MQNQKQLSRNERNSIQRKGPLNINNRDLRSTRINVFANKRDTINFKRDQMFDTMDQHNYLSTSQGRTKCEESR